MRVFFSKTIPAAIVVVLFLFYGCGTNSYNTNFSYAPADAGKSVRTSTIYSNTRHTRTESSRLISIKPDLSKPIETPKIRANIPTSEYSEIGPVLNKNLALKAINAYRLKNGAKPLRFDKKLDHVAKLHSTDMSKQDKISHIGSDGSDPWDRIEKTGYRIEMATENLGTGVKDFDKLFTLWKGSKVHNANLLVPDATHMGLALVYSQETKLKSFWTLVITKRSKGKLVTGSTVKAPVKSSTN